ncbi:hypothetical protein BGZ93_006356 [Podila epicladia]|nr:hypothetical protein BGZ93_006356 [Podila epicladia]
MSSTPHGANAPPQVMARQNDDSDSDSGKNPFLLPLCDHQRHLHLLVFARNLYSLDRLAQELGDMSLDEYDDYYEYEEYSKDSGEYHGNDVDDCVDDYDEESDDDDETEVYNDIHVCIRGQSHTVIESDAFHVECNSDTRRNLYDILEEYFDFLSTDLAFAQQQRDKIKCLSPIEKQELGVKVRDHIADGRVFFCSFQPSDQDLATIGSEVRKSISGNGTLVKIRYATGPVYKSVSQLAKECRLQHSEVVASYPGEKQSPIGFVHLLEKVIQELFATRQEDMQCHGCGMIHGDIFEFEAVGKRKRTESARLHVQSMAREILKWVDFLSELYPIHLSVADTQGKMLDLIKKKLSGTSTRVLW